MVPCGALALYTAQIANTALADFGEDGMANWVHGGPTIATQALRALRRYPDRTAFAFGNSSLSYRGTIDLIARMQAVFLEGSLQRGQRIGLLSANRADAWCSGIAASASGLSLTSDLLT